MSPILVGWVEPVRSAAQELTRVGSVIKDSRPFFDPELLQSSQSRVARIEAGSSDVSLDLMFRSLFAVGGGVADVLRMQSTRRSASGSRSPGKKKKTLASAGH